MENPTKHTDAIAHKNGKVSRSFEYLSPPATPQAEESTGNVFDLLRRRIALIAGVATATTAAVWLITWNQDPVYSNAFQILVEPVNAESQQNRDPLSNQPTAAQKGNVDYPTQIEVLRSPKLLEPVFEQIKTKYPDVTYDMLALRTKITHPTDTKLLLVTYEDSDPDRVKFVLDKLSEAYLRYSQKERESNLGYGIAFVDRQIGETRQRVDSLQRQMQAFRQQNNFIGPEALSSQVTGQLQSLSQQRLDTDKQIAELQRQYGNLQERSGSMAALASDASYQKVLDKLRELESKIATESTRFQDDNAEIRALRQQRDSLLPVLRQEAQRVLGNQLAKLSADLSVLTTRQQVLSRSEDFWNQEVQRLPVLARVFTDLDRERNVATESLNRLLRTRETLQVEAAQKEIPWQLITPAERPNQPKDSKERNLILGALVGLLLGIGAALLSDRFDHRLRSLSELKKISKLPILGTIPHEANPLARGAVPQILKTLQSNRSAYDAGQYSKFTESFRSLYTNLCLQNLDHPIRSLVISSPTPGDGKTTVALYLAQAAAAMGGRVLLVDADLRNPQIAERLDIESDRGLIEIVLQSLNPQDVIQRLETANVSAGSSRDRPIEPATFSVLPGGNLAIDPTRLLSSQKMQRLVDYFKGRYDLVIFDAPPLLSFADSSLLAGHTDGMIVVTGLGKTDQADLRQMLDTLQTARISVLGLVANLSSSDASEY